MLSKKCQYALHALLYVVEHRQTFVQVSEISETRHIPKKFLEVIMLDLKNAGILGSKKGKGGGYFLKKEPHTISVIQIIRLIDGAVAMLPCVSLNYYESCGMCSNESTCSIKHVFGKVRDETLRILENTTLEDMKSYPLTLPAGPAG